MPAGENDYKHFKAQKCLREIEERNIFIIFLYPEDGTPPIKLLWSGCPTNSISKTHCSIRYSYQHQQPQAQMVSLVTFS